MSSKKPQSAPHYGIVWERNVLLIKREFLLIISGNRLSRDLIATENVDETEAIIDSRPLSHVSNDIDDNLPLLANHFLVVAHLSTLQQQPSRKLLLVKCPTNPGSEQNIALTASGGVYTKSTPGSHQKD